ncbi:MULTISPECIES: hypothetical protein [unclassified Micromonospora]|uniref:hypothetical protein n=1 Tax=unclassified Micromonospora TaxID=2617518 RepID=UPI001C5EAEFF|nr:hypothetical protein [Micromonospora sp. RL09-050-HVF-A]MBW4703029.1 hypothetical protein [Micromonospora sp. RL09-050-HVF-A]
MPLTRIPVEATTLVPDAPGGIDASPAYPVPRHGVAVGTPGVAARPDRAGRR